ncbi:TPA: TetR/AcrR family transcriptional regulator [Enterococcus faecium]|uniref:TetR/AcrR family transcriptional regulator n=1 Tax=Enterococcus sp. HMSC055G03 TaxID=1739313 RepID=UPI0008A10703|nr:TetR/AcrR family transcriptional regulator [Enterococcus sp. HMSC055G03]OFK64040.1 TetR family transcriptional regulator [Enterococcus sp. HMSC055G03]HAY6720062.1 TetR/AcrR family transcriptional regulator [Enterococcus faecium]
MVHRYNKDTQQKILKEATDLFMSKGYLGTSTREIAQKVGITQPNLYHYFGDKEKLYTAVLENHLKDVGKALREIVQTSETGFQVTLTKMAQFLIETHLVDLFLMLHDLESNLSKETRDHLFFLWKKNYREPFEEIFSANQSVLRNGISKEIAASHFFLVLAPYITRSKRPVEEPLNVAQLIDLYLNGVLGEA